MNEYKKYPKIHRLGKDETDGILEYEVYVQEKIDGANISIFLLDGEIRCGTRTRMLPKEESFNGFQEAVMANRNLEGFFETNPNYILYGEWLVRHTISYPETAYRKIYLFDIYNAEEDVWVPQDDVQEVAEYLEFEYPHVFSYGKFSEEQVLEFVGKSNIAPVGEGVVLKSKEFINKFGDPSYAKIVTQKFKEDNSLVFGGNNKHSETYWEMYVVNKYCTVARVQKIMQKVQSMTEEKLDKKHTPQITGTCYHDLITEEAWEISKKVQKLDFYQLKRLAIKKFVQIYHDILNDELSIADTNKE